MLELKNISFVIDADSGRKKTILNDVSLNIDTDKFVVMTGPNGSGKTLLAKIIMGIEQPSSGQILFDGEDITELDITERAKRGIGFAFQQPVRFKGFKVREMINLAAGKRLPAELLDELMRQVGLCGEEYLEREVDSALSGGEIKRIEIAMVLAREPRLAIFDEPEAGIDLWSFRNLVEIFKKMKKDKAQSILVVSHQERILEIADQIIVVSKGKISDIGPRSEILPKIYQDKIL